VQRLTIVAGFRDAPVALIEDRARPLDRTNRVDGNRHNYAKALPTIIDSEGAAVS
jgi:hypothetical protein